MTLTGTVRNGVIVLDDHAALAEGTPVRVEPVQVAGGDVPGEVGATTHGISSLAAMLMEFAGKAENLPSDMAENRDHYLYGTPKK